MIRRDHDFAQESDWVATNSSLRRGESCWFGLLAREAGLDTCAQEYWSSRHGAISRSVGAPENEMLFCGMAIGHADPEAPVNTLTSERFGVDEFAVWI